MRAALPVLAALAVAAACSTNEANDGPSIPCSLAPSDETFERASNVRVFADDAVPAEVRADVATYLGRLWSTPTEVTTGAPTGDAIVLRLDASVQGYTLVRGDEAGAKRLVVSAGTKADLVTATYALLEELGIRFFHPMQELVPSYDAPRFPRRLDVRRHAWVKTRGLQVHVLHPLEWFRPLMEPGEQNLSEAKRLVDWLVKTGQNHLQWPLLRTVDWASFAEHARKIADYAHARGVNVGCSLNLSVKGSLQGNYVLVTDDAQHEAQIEAGLRRAMEVPWDDVEIALGEFLAADPEALLRWLDAAVASLATIAPGVRIAVQNHVGNYDSLYSDFRGVPHTYFYHVPKYADPRLGQTVHTLFWHDLYRPGGMYQHPDFSFQREFIFEELASPEKRRVRYFPESAYFIATDIDVPAFLPEFIESRWTDIHRLAEDIRSKGLAPLDGHTLFTSGHEWGYWLTDYLVAKMLWEPDAPLDRFVSHYTSAYGSCAPAVQASLSRVIDLQRTFLLEKRLIPYVSGEDNAVDLGALAGFTIREPRKRFDDLVLAPEPERAAFEATVVADLETVIRETRPIEDDLAAHCRGSDAPLVPWCEELRDGVRIVRLRLEHTVALYRSVLAHARGNAGEANRLLHDAMAITERAKEVILEREKHYRFDVERLTAAYDNPTVYKFGYLRQAHTQCLWRRQDEQARRIVEENLVGSKPTGLPSCLD